jgi:hypothetical protein
MWAGSGDEAEDVAYLIVFVLVAGAVWLVLVIDDWRHRQ